MFALDYALFGLRPLGWHVASLALHAVNAALVWLFLVRRLAGPGGPGLIRAPADPRRLGSVAATVGALGFAVHPVTTESVAWISSRGDLLAWTFALLVFEAFARPGARATAAGVVLGALACLAKESALVLFVLVPLAHVSLPRDRRPSWRTTSGRAALLAVVTAAYLALRQAVLPGSPDFGWLAQTALPDGGRAGALRGFLASVGWYARTLVLPTGFPFDRNVHTDPVPGTFLDPGVIVGAGIAGSLIAGGVRALVSRRGAAATACLASLAALGPVSNVIVPLKAFAAERFLYPALPFLALGVGALVRRGLEAFPRRRVALVAVAGVLLAALGVAAWVRAGPWRDEGSLWRAVLAEEPMNPRAYEGIGFGELMLGRLARAERAFKTYREFQPRDGKVRAELAATFLRLAEDLVPRDEAAVEESNVVERRRMVLREAIEECRAAWAAWSREGLARARGDAALVRSTLEGWRLAALEFGALSEAGFVNATLAEDDRLRTGTVAYAERRFVAMLPALVLVTTPPPGTADPGGARARTRAELVRAAGIDPDRSDLEVGAKLLEGLAALLAEKPGDLALRRVRTQVLGARLSALELATPRGEIEMLGADLDILARAFPRDRTIAELRDVMRRR